MASIEAQVQNSTCFGVGYDETVPECQECSVGNRCKYHTEKLEEEKLRENQKGRSNMSEKPEVVEENVVAEEETEVKDEAPKKRKARAKKPPKQYDPDMPEFSKMTIEEIEDNLRGRDLDLIEFDKYTDEKIRRMRLTMKAKSFYEVK